MRRAFADRAEYMGDSDFVKVPVAGLIDKSYAATLRATIKTDRASTSAEVRAGRPAGYESDETTVLLFVGVWETRETQPTTLTRSTTRTARPQSRKAPACCSTTRWTTSQPSPAPQLCTVRSRARETPPRPA